MVGKKPKWSWDQDEGRPPQPLVSKQHHSWDPLPHLLSLLRNPGRLCRTRLPLAFLITYNIVNKKYYFHTVLWICRAAAKHSLVWSIPRGSIGRWKGKMKPGHGSIEREGRSRVMRHSIRQCCFFKVGRRMAQRWRDLWATPGSCLILIIPTFLCMIQQSPLLAQLT